MSTQALYVIGFTLIIAGTVVCTAFLPRLVPITVYSIGATLIIAGLGFIWAGARKAKKARRS
jgi:hypothetical protein